MAAALVWLAGCAGPDSSQFVDFAAQELESNAQATHRTALVHITESQILQPPHEGEVPDEDFIVIRYTAQVVEDYVGEGPIDIVFAEYVDPSEGVRNVRRGQRIVSLCEQPDANYYLPGEGFDFAGMDDLTERVSAKTFDAPDGSACTMMR